MANKTESNPYGLTTKDMLIIEDFQRAVLAGEKPDIRELVERYYPNQNPKSLSVTKHEKLANPNFREALINGFYENGIIGKDSIIDKKLREGLEAVTIKANGEEVPDYKTRLAYIQEIHKVTGLYAPKQTESKNLNLNLSAEEADKRIKAYEAELSE